MSKLLPDGPLDTLGVLDAIQATPEAVAAAAVIELDPPPPAAAGIVLLASGADALVADAAQALVAPTSPVPVVVHTGYGIPSFVSDEWRCIVVSRGSTPEGMDALRGAVGHRAKLSAVGSGPLVETAAERDASVVRLHDVPPAPRIGFAPTLVALLRFLDRVGVLTTPLGGPGLETVVAAAAEQLTVRRNELDGAGEAAVLARRIGRTLPLIYAAGPIGAVVATRWKNQVNDNAKVAAFSASLPELAHHELSGWGQHGDMTRQVFSLITLRHDQEDAPDAERFAAVEELVDEVVGARHEVLAGGDGSLAQLLDLVFVGDLFSYHLAQANEIDPGPTAVDVELQRFGRA